MRDRDDLEDRLERIECKLDCVTVGLENINERLENLMPDLTALSAALDRIEAAEVTDFANDANAQAAVDALTAHAADLASKLEAGQPAPAPVPAPTDAPPTV